MSYAAIEVELHEGRVVASSAEPLPQEGKGLLVILSTTGTENARHSWQNALGEIRRKQTARQHTPRTADAVTAQLHHERTSWE